MGEIRSYLAQQDWWGLAMWVREHEPLRHEERVHIRDAVTHGPGWWVQWHEGCRDIREIGWVVARVWDDGEPQEVTLNGSDWGMSHATPAFRMTWSLAIIAPAVNALRSNTDM